MWLDLNFLAFLSECFDSCDDDDDGGGGGGGGEDVDDVVDDVSNLTSLDLALLLPFVDLATNPFVVVVVSTPLLLFCSLVLVVAAAAASLRAFVLNLSCLMRLSMLLVLYLMLNSFRVVLTCLIILCFE